MISSHHINLWKSYKFHYEELTKNVLVLLYYLTLNRKVPSLITTDVLARALRPNLIMRLLVTFNLTKIRHSDLNRVSGSVSSSAFQSWP